MRHGFRPRLTPDAPPMTFVVSLRPLKTITLADVTITFGGTTLPASSVTISGLPCGDLNYTAAKRDALEFEAKIRRE